MNISETVSCPLAELQCTTISMEFESRPRTSAMKFSLAVGSLYLEDLTNQKTAFPYLICPQSKVGDLDMFVSLLFEIFEMSKSKSQQRR